jgi:plastocyanin domain-containing protein
MRTICTIIAITGLLAAAACAKEGKSGAAPAQADGRIQIQVTSDGFVPARAKVKVGQPVTLVVTRKTDRTCATEIVIKDYNINQPLPLNQPVEVTFTPKAAGKIRFACGMDMIAGELIAE